MRALLLFWISLIGGIYCVLAGDGEKKNKGQDISENIPPMIDDLPVIVEEGDHDYNDTDNDDEEGRSLKIRINRPSHRNKTITVRLPNNDKKDIEKIKRLLEKQEERHHTKLYVKIIGGIIAVFIIGGLTVCYRFMCKKKRQTIISDPEETVPSLSPLGLYPDQQNAYLPQPNAYPSQPNVYPSQPGAYPPEQSLYPLHQVPYPHQPSAFNQQLNIYVPTQQNAFDYPTGLTSHPPPNDGNSIPLTKR